LPLFSLSGGLVYHLRALRYRSGLWAPFRSALREWLAERLPRSAELLLVGPSAGHCLPLGELSRFERITVLEPDPLARRLLARRLRPAHVELEQRDLLVEPLLSGRAGLDALLKERPTASLLFCNLLGQLRFDLTDEQQARFESEFRSRLLPLLAGRRWASFHDYWSLDRDRAEPSPARLDFERQPSDDELGVAWFGARGKAVTVLDHGTSALFPPSLPRRYFSWQITPAALHIVEAVAGP
jgi:hypothetical protein